MNYEPVIGLEVHAQLKTASKIFCSCSTAFGAPPNTQVCPVCLGLPGVLPVANKKVVEFALRLGLAIEAEIAPRSVFARKNYFYPDLPKGYQISQYELPMAEHGRLEIKTGAGAKEVGITRIHLEEDAGKLVHDEHKPVSYVDLNRCGVPLIEIVSEPDIRSAEEAMAYLRTLRKLVRYLDISDGNMEEGSFRCDANISLRPVGRAQFGTRAEVKNMNSFRGVGRALDFEIRRQRAALEGGGEVVQETRLWDADKGETFSMRSKEEAHDYRYLPDPDLIPMEIDQAWIEKVRDSLPELPWTKWDRFKREYTLSDDNADVLTASRQLADYFETAASACQNPKMAANWIMTEVLSAVANVEEMDSFIANVPPASMGDLIRLVDEGTISGKMAKEVFEEMKKTGQPPKGVIESKGLRLISDEGELEGMIDEIIAANPDNVAKYRGGKKKVLGFFVGQVMAQTKGQADPKLVNEILQKKLQE